MISKRSDEVERCLRNKGEVGEMRVSLSSNETLNLLENVEDPSPSFGEEVRDALVGPSEVSREDASPREGLSFCEMRLLIFD